MKLTKRSTNQFYTVYMERLIDDCYQGTHIICNDCNAKFKQKRSLRLDMKQHHSKRKTCRNFKHFLQSYKTEKSKKPCRPKIEDIEVPSKPSSRSESDKSMNIERMLENDSNLRENFYSESSDDEVEESKGEKVTKPFECSLCKKKFRLQERLRAHSRIHTGERPFTCHVCGKQFGQAGSLYYHLKHVHDGIKNHSCDICGRSFAMKTSLQDHRRIHTGERPYICDTCGKTFKSKAALYIHNKSHTDEFPYKCSYCSKGFRWKQKMLGHVTIHTGEKNHTCETCGKQFRMRNDLSRHKRIHSNDKPYVCQHCGVGFGQKRYLKCHERGKQKRRTSFLGGSPRFLGDTEKSRGGTGRKSLCISRSLGHSYSWKIRSHQGIGCYIVTPSTLDFRDSRTAYFPFIHIRLTRQWK
ncbi:gastrula zinc finger protein XlCGF57.1-like [Prorops nasuta]|uniref:gastrula zinc finger protein XlCGF57.1-like n=1 Tax=Prorops nasuta TaxID=863751 RepID=UPI0034CE762A